MGLSQWTRVLI